MPFYLLSWHGALVGYTGLRLHPVSFAQAFMRGTTPATLDEQSTALSPGEAFTTAEPIENFANRPLVSVRAGKGYLSSREQTLFDVAPLCATWEHFLLLPPELLSILRDLTEQEWYCKARFVGRATCAEHHVHLGGHKWPAEQLQAERKGDTITLWTDATPEKITFTACPSRVLSGLVEDLLHLLQTKTLRPTTTPWATLEDLREQLLRLSVTPRDTNTCIHLARLCALFGQWELADGFLTIARQHDTRSELQWMAAILALRTKNNDTAAKLMEQALTSRYPDRDLGPLLAPLVARQQNGENALLLVPAALSSIGLPAFETPFDMLLMPMRLAAKNGPDIRRVYSRLFEQAFQKLDTENRLRLLTAEARLNGLSWWEELGLGHTSWLAGLQAEADTHYAIARKLAVQDNMTPALYDQGVFSWLSMHECGRLASRAIPDVTGVANWQWHFSMPEEQPGTCLSFACTGKHFDVVPGLVLSLIHACREDRSAGKIQLCLGIAHPTVDQLTFLSTVSEWLEKHSTTLRLSFGHGETRSDATMLEPALRYLILPDIAAQFRTPVLIGDCAGYFPANFISLLRDMKAHATYGFDLTQFDDNGQQQYGTPWSMNTDLAYFGEAELVPAIAAFMSDYLNTVCAPSNPYPTDMDRCTLAQMFRRFVASRWAQLSIRFLNDGPSMLVIPHHNQAGLVTPEDVLNDLKAHIR
ncbi:hypothetical protein AZ09_00495 [Acetobacter aceti 1023]|nr:hypothetical protein AZ09_00495 [Acetobacter aceti 1023]